MMKTIILIFFVALIAIGVQMSLSAPYISNTYENTLVAKIIGYRLPTNTAPKLYTINIEPHMEDEKFSFDGGSTIVFEVLSPTATVVLHASKFLEINKTDTRLIHDDDTIEKPVAQRWNPSLEFYSVRFREPLKVGTYALGLSWKGHQVTTADGSDQYDGFFRAVDKRKYDDDTYVAATNFEATSARSAFPCWDEPAFKAEFVIAIRHHPNYTVLSNMPAIGTSEPELDDKVWTLFDRSPPMSTYLVAFAIVPYEHHVDDKQNITTWVPEEKLRDARISFEISRLIPNAMERYTGIPYNLPKMDHVILPHYGSEAVENWGLILYSDKVLFNPDKMDAKKLMYTMYLTSHEIIHQWFGNLVTPAWWDDLWLSEAFTQYFSYKMLDDVIQNWNAKEIYASIILNEAAFYSDRLTPNHPIRSEVESKDEIEEMFSDITYDKGGALVQMLEHVLTEKTFQYGIQKYLQEHQFGSATSDDLWESLQEAYNEKHVTSYMNIKELMDSWLDQTGYPLVNVTRDYRTGFVFITQNDATDRDSGNLWTIPINYATSERPSFESTEPTHWMRRANETLTLYGVDKDDWIILNIQQTGFYRVHYDWENWRRIIAFLNTDNFHKIHVINRAQILYDLAYFVHFDHQYWELLLDAVEYLHKETNYLPWHSVMQELKQYLLVFMNTPSSDMFKRFIVYLMDNMVNHIGFDNKMEDDYLTRMARSEILTIACIFGHQGCEAVAPVKFREILSREVKTFDLDSKIWIYCATLKYADERTWDMVMDIHFANPREQESYKFLGCMKNHDLIKKYLNLAMANNATVLTEDVLDGLITLIMGPGENLNFVLDLWVNNIEEFTEHFTKMGSGKYIDRITELFATMIKTENQYEKYAAFLRKQTEDGVMDSEMSNTLMEGARKSMRTAEKAAAMFNSFLQKKPHLLNILHNMRYPPYDF